jgi:hypothetical protein
MMVNRNLNDLKISVRNLVLFAKVELLHIKTINGKGFQIAELLHLISSKERIKKLIPAVGLCKKIIHNQFYHLKLSKDITSIEEDITTIKKKNNSQLIFLPIV